MSTSKRAGDSEIEVAPSNTYVAAFIDTCLRDARLSWKAKGLAAYLLSKPPGWKIWTSDLIARSTDGRDAVLSGLAELEQCGYLNRERWNDPETGQLRWRKTIVATPAAPSTENPVMGGAPSTGYPYTGEPYTDNPTHSSSQGSSTHSSKNLKRVEKGARAGAVPEAAEKNEVHEQAPLSDTEQDVLARILADCQVQAPADLLGAYGLEHVRAEAVRWWNETPAHNRKKNAGLLVYRIRNRKYAPLTADERAMCDRYTFWTVFVAPDDTDAPSVPAEAPESAPAPKQDETHTYQPGNPLSAWSALLYELALERDATAPGTTGASLTAWLAKCQPAMDGETLRIMPPDNLYRDWVSSRLMPRLNRKLAVIRMRAPDAPAQIALA